MDTKKVSIEDLGNIVGEDNVREASSEDSVEGVEPSFVAEPGSVEEISELLKFASGAGLAIYPRGGGTKTYLGDIPRAADLIVSTRRMNGVIEHVPGDQIVRVQAGVTLEDLQEQVSGSDQMVALDPPERSEGATMGGIVASNSSGPRRYKYGTVRDLIIGIQVVLYDGTVAKAGGKVVKNVAGYDLSKLFTGSLGTLGVISGANFRLHPVPEAARTVAVEVENPQAAFGAAQAITHSQTEPTAVELHYGEDQKLLTVLLESIPEGVEAKEAAASFLLKSFGEVRTLSDEEVEHLGPLSPPPVGDDAAVVKVAVPPAELGNVLEAVLGATERKGLDHPRMTGHAATGITFVGLSGGDVGAMAEVVEEVREIFTRKGGSVVLHRAPVELKRRVGAWGPGSDDIGLVRRVKEKFDPLGTMNPGRFIGGI